MKIYVTFCCLLLAFSLNAQRIKLDFEPKGKIIKFYFDGLTIYTDTASLFQVLRENETIRNFDLRVKNLVLQQFINNKSDTAIFSGNFIPLNDSVDTNNQTEWYVQGAILRLTKANRLKIYDKHGQLVKIIVTKKIGTKKKGYVRRAFINKATKEELFSELLFMQTITPSF